MNLQLGPYAVVAITKNGAELAGKLQNSLGNTDIYVKRKFLKESESNAAAFAFDGSASELIGRLFQSYKGLILLFSLGAAVRLIAPYLKDKKTDPAVVVVDEQGKYAISVASGHLGGANQLTERVAEILQAHSVITTASDRQKTIAVDLLGKEFGWTWESPENLTAVSAAVVNGESVVIIQESGERTWWPEKVELPANLKLVGDFSTALAAKPDAVIWITHRLISHQELAAFPVSIIYRPKVLVLGMGCNRGTSEQEIEAVIKETLAELKFSINSVKAICTINIKKDEPGLWKIVDNHGWEFHYYTSEELNSVKLEAPSTTVFHYTGAYGVSEPAAKLYSGAASLAVVKKKSGNVTISVAVRTNKVGSFFETCQKRGEIVEFK